MPAHERFFTAPLSLGALLTLLALPGCGPVHSAASAPDAASAPATPAVAASAAASGTAPRVRIPRPVSPGSSAAR